MKFVDKTLPIAIVLFWILSFRDRSAGAIICSFWCFADNKANRKKAGEAYPFVLIIEFSLIQYTKGISTLFSITCLTWFKNPLLKSDFIIFFLWLLLSATFGDESEQNFWSMWISPVLCTFLNFLTYRIVKTLYPFRVFSFNYYKK